MTVRPQEEFIILIAEDDDDDFYLSQEALKKSKFQTQITRTFDGEETIKYLRGEGKFSDRLNFPFPNLILLDLNMPKINGIEVIKYIKTDPALRSLPIVVLTTSKSEEDVVASYCAGGNSYIRKPVKFKELLDAMTLIGEYWLELGELPRT